MYTFDKEIIYTKYGLGNPSSGMMYKSFVGFSESSRSKEKTKENFLSWLFGH